MRELTKQQRALAVLLEAGYQCNVVDLIGRNHPTAKWFFRETGWRIDDQRALYIIEQAENILQYDAHLQTTNAGEAFLEGMGEIVDLDEEGGG